MLSPIAVHVYKCPSCGKRINGFVLDLGETPEMIPCKCGFPRAKKSFISEHLDLARTTLSPSLYFRFPTEDEYEKADETGKKYMASKGLIIEWNE